MKKCNLCQIMYNLRKQNQMRNEHLINQMVVAPTVCALRAICSTLGDTAVFVLAAFPYSSAAASSTSQAVAGSSAELRAALQQPSKLLVAAAQQDLLLQHHAHAAAAAAAAAAQQASPRLPYMPPRQPGNPTDTEVHTWLHC